VASPMSEKRILIVSPHWVLEGPNEATSINTNALARSLAERKGIRPIVFTQAMLTPPLRQFRQGRALYIVANQRWPRRIIKMLGWLTTLLFPPHQILLLNRHALTLLPTHVIVQMSDVVTAYIGEHALSVREVRLLRMVRRVYVESQSTQRLLPHAMVQPMGTDLRPFTLSTPSPPPPWRICFASSPLPWHEPEEIEMRYLKARGVLDTLRLVKALRSHVPVQLTLVWRKDSRLICRLTAPLPFVSVKAENISNMNAFLNPFHLYAALFRPGEERYYKPLPNSVVEAMAKGIFPIAYTGTLVGQRIASITPGLLLSTTQTPTDQAKAIAHSLPALFTPENRGSLRREALQLDLRHFISRLLEED